MTRTLTTPLPPANRFPETTAPASDDPAALESQLHRARHEAEALAWASGFPQLVLPCLLAEKEAEARAYWRRQQEIRSRSARWLSRVNPRELRLAA